MFRFLRFYFKISIRALVDYILDLALTKIPSRIHLEASSDCATSRNVSEFEQCMILSIMR